MSRPLRASHASMDPNRSMGASHPSSLFAEDTSNHQHPARDIAALNMNPQSTEAAATYVQSKEHNTGLDDRGAQLSARMRKSGKAGMAVSARLYKDASVREQKLKKAQEEREREEILKLEEDITQERTKWRADKSGPATRYAINENGEQVVVQLHESLYKEHEKRTQKQEHAMQKHLKMLQDKEEELLKKSKHAKWGVPRISKKAHECARQGRHVWERICDWDGTQRKKHLESMRKQQECDEMKACTFDIAESISHNPETGYGGRSAKLVDQMVSKLPAGQEPASNRFDALYKDARQRQLRIEQYQNWYPEDQSFNPDIGPDRYRPRLDETEEEFINRLTYCKQDKMSQPVAQPQIDQNTGQHLFQPVTGRSPLFQRNSQGLPIGDYLHSYSYDKQEDRKITEAEQQEHARQLCNQRKTTSNSEFIMERMREQQLFEIFSVIDADGDGLIDPQAAEHAAHTRLPAEIANDIVPLVMESKSVHNFESFFHLCQGVVSSAQVGPKGYLVPERERHLKSIDEYVSSKDYANMQLNLSQRSMQLADERRAHRTGSLYDVLSEEREVWDERRRHMGEVRAAEDLAACTFQPNVERVGMKPAMSAEVAQRLVKPMGNVKAVTASRPQAVTST